MPKRVPDAVDAHDGKVDGPVTIELRGADER
jgi:hypothetical protein